MKNILIYAYQSSAETIEEHVFTTLQAMQKSKFSIYFATNHQLDKKQKELLGKYCDQIIIDQQTKSFYSLWLKTLKQLLDDLTICFENLILLNNHFFGPLFPIEIFWNKFLQSKADYYRSFSSESLSNDAEEIEASLIILKYAVIAKLKSRLNTTITEDYAIKDKNLRFSHQLDQLLKENSEIKYNDSKQMTNNNLANIINEKQHPFISINEIMNYPHPKYLISVISQQINYPINDIINYINQNYPPNISMKMSNKLIIAHEDEKIKVNHFKVAVHLHIYYVDLLSDLLKSLSQHQLDYFLTTDTNEKKLAIEKVFKQHHIAHQIKKIKVVPNHGRDVLPWLALSQELSQYDLVGHFHTKKTAWTDSWIGDSWWQNLLNDLCLTFPTVVNHFANDEKLGIIIPDVPDYFHQHYDQDPFDADSHGRNRQICQNLWTKINSSKKINFADIIAPIMPYGMMFWYRPQALKLLFDLNLQANDFEAEPLSNDGTLAHALERLPVYLSWAAGYDYRFISHREQAISKHLSQEYHLQKLKDKNSLIQGREKSLSWKIGRLFTFLPRKILKKEL